MVGEVRFKYLVQRWGSCSQAGNLNFNIKIVMAPMSQVEYVVAHELCHLLYSRTAPNGPDLTRVIGCEDTVLRMFDVLCKR